uniref:Uncharacterized protein n=1 Tax=Hucho hucho TaxID=62062 RepID=A0A4W5KY46_9TELE
MLLLLFTGTRKSVSRLSMTDFSIDLNQEQLISASIQTMEAISDTEDQEDLGKLTEADKANTGRVSSTVLAHNS